MGLGDLKPKKGAAVVRANLAEIEAALERGLTREQVWEELKKEHQLNLTFHAFYTSLQRARRDKAKVQPESRPLPQPTPAKAKPVEKVDCAIQSTNESEPEEVDCAIQKEAGQAAPSPAENKRRNMIRSSKEIRDSASLDFNDLGQSKY